jgi:hypothetical protein
MRSLTELMLMMGAGVSARHIVDHRLGTKPHYYERNAIS